MNPTLADFPAKVQAQIIAAMPPPPISPEARQRAEAAGAKADARAERQLQNEFESWLRLNGYLYRREPMHKATMAPPGHPDFTVYAANGKTVFFEWKTLAGRLSDEQKEYHRQLKELGHAVFVVRSLEAAKYCLSILTPAT